jgi:putative oxidoreductase
MNVLSSQPLENFDKVMAIVRIITGLFMAYHGLEVFNAQQIADYANWEQIKTLPQPLLWAYLGKGGELLSGVLLAIGLFTRYACLGMISIMLFILFVIGKGIFWYDDQHPFLFILLGIIYFFYGAGKYSIDK